MLSPFFAFSRINNFCAFNIVLGRFPPSLPSIFLMDGHLIKIRGAKKGQISRMTGGTSDITHAIVDGTLYFTVRFTEQTSFCVRYACDMFAVGAELSD